MNGFGGRVRGFLASATSTASPPPSDGLPLKPGQPTWPPQSPYSLPYHRTLALPNPHSPMAHYRRLRRRLNLIPSSLSRVPPPPQATRLATSRTAMQPPLNTRDELLMSLLASEAVVDSRDFEILSSEEVDDLKKVHIFPQIHVQEQQVLTSRQGAMTKKLALETKIRDAALSLSRVNAAHKKVSKQSEEQLEAASKRVESAERELFRVSSRANEIQKRLLEHRAGVLSYSVRTLESKNKKENVDSGYNTPSAQLSPALLLVVARHKRTAVRFDGAHFFAGHAETVSPSGKGTPPPAFLALEEKLARATEALAASSAKQAELARELAAAQADRDARLEGMGEDMQALEREKAAWAEERAALIQEHEAERAAWDRDKNDAEDERLEDLARLQDETERLRADDAAAMQKVQSELDEGVSILRALARTHSVPLYTGDAGLAALVSAFGSHLLGLATKMQDDVRSGLDKREALSREVEEARREREQARNEVRALELRAKTDTLRSPPLSPTPLAGDSRQVAAMLQPLWVLLPSPEARAAAAKFGQQSRFRPGSGASSPTQPSSPNPSSLSDLDVRSLKSLYDPRTPASPNPNSNAPFSMDAFVSRVQALIADDRALIERLVRFAQAHDLLKKNAERAQKLAQEGSGALETYQKQVRTLEERNMELANRVSGLQDEVSRLQSTIERVSAEKLDVETQAAEQAATLEQLTEANNTLSAKTLALAAEAADAPEAVRRQLEGQLAEARAGLDDARAEIDAMRMSEQGQSMALLDELNTMQMENSKLREQLRAVKK
ncbi:Up-regulated during septation-domain-containing protein [Roridomyces roridus]|uniref:Up-regulated during septation-domain-containing protein n=1 Tax=Roridomyces roridus TaxID=1738132 RepID=A0AAD7FRT1_9AGAR|nr:Up-regulated during septation-domain-containing protein [Roridomyces roridus]